MALQTKGGKFVALMRALAKKKSASRGNKPALQHGNALTKKAPMGGGEQFLSGIVKKGPGLTAQPTFGQSAMNDEQEGA